MNVITYCCNLNCPFRDCDRHLVHAPKGEECVSIANFDATCRRYITDLVKEEYGKIH